MSCNPSAKADWSNLRFERIRRDRSWVELEKTKPVESWGRSLANGAGLAAFLAFIILVVMR